MQALALPLLIAGVAGTAGAVIGSKLAKPKSQPTAEQKVPLPPVTRDAAREAADRRDAINRRRGGAADVVTGAFGAEAPPGSTGKVTLGS